MIILDTALKERHQKHAPVRVGIVGAGYLGRGIAEGCVLRRDVAKDQPLRFEDVEMPPERLIDRLWAEQNTHFETKFGEGTQTSFGREEDLFNGFEVSEKAVSRF
jgi:predicted homoserine dehydrogenase-like protein